MSMWFLSGEIRNTCFKKLLSYFRVRLIVELSAFARLGSVLTISISLFAPRRASPWRFALA